MINYDAQISQTPTPYYYGTARSSKKKQLGMMVLGGLVGMNAYYMPVQKDVFVQRGFDMVRDKADEQIERLTKIAREVAKNKVTTESRLYLQNLGVAEDVDAISRECTAIEESVSDSASVKNIKDSLIDSFDKHGKKTYLMDDLSSDAYRAVRRNKFKWGLGIGAGIGLALGLISSRD